MTEMKKRLDVYLYESGYTESRSLARAAVMEGRVSVDGSTAMKPGTQVSGDEEIAFERQGNEYVSRGGIKLEHALDVFGVDVAGKVVLDVGSSTGGFTDCVLRRGASKVIALDVGRGQLHWRLRNDPRVIVMERYNARGLTSGDLAARPHIATVDVSFISLEKVIGPIRSVLPDGGEIVALLKPQFEAPRRLGKGGVVRDPLVHARLIGELAAWLEELGLVMKQVTASPLTGPKGNVEFFTHLVGRPAEGVGPEEIERAVEEAHRGGS